MATNNYVIGRGKLYFDQFITGTQTKTGERYLGNTPALSMTSAYQNLDHYSSDEGLRVRDDSIQLQVDRNGTFQCDNITMDNVALMFGASPTDETQGTDTGRSETFTVLVNRIYQLGADDPLTPQGVINVANVVVTNNSGLHAYGSVTFAAAGVPVDGDTIVVNGQTITFQDASPIIHEILIGATPVEVAQAFKAEINAYPALYDVSASGDANIINLVAIASGTGGNSITLTESATNVTVSGATLTGGTASSTIAATNNFTIDAARGRITILEDPADITDGDELEIVYDIQVGAFTLVIDEENQVEGALRFIADNPRGDNKDYYWPRVKLTPSGEFALKGETWQTMTFNMEVLQPAGTGIKRVYVTQQ
jgi:hypothetical protein